MKVRELQRRLNLCDPEEEVEIVHAKSVKLGVFDRFRIVHVEICDIDRHPTLEIVEDV